MSRRKQLFGSQDWLICLVIASPWLIGLAALGARELSHLLPYADAAHPAKPDVFRAWVELLSLVGSFGLFVTAIIAGCITYSQLRDARAARLAAVYLEVNKTYNSDLMRQSRMEILRIRREFEASGAPGDLAAYLADRMMGWKIDRRRLLRLRSV